MSETGGEIHELGEKPMLNTQDTMGKGNISKPPPECVLARGLMCRNQALCQMHKTAKLEFFALVLWDNSGMGI